MKPEKTGIVFTDLRICDADGNIHVLAVPTTQLIIQENNQPPSALALPTDEEVLDLATHDNQPDNPKRTSTEIARAFSNPELFITQTIKEKLSGNTAEISEVVSHLRKEDKKDYSRRALYRTQETVVYSQGDAEAPGRYSKSTPGALETVGLTLSGFMTEQGLGIRIPVTAAELLYELIEDYRVNTETGVETPEMPDLIRQLTATLDSAATNPLLRTEIYEILGQVKIPDSFAQELVQKMDRTRDLDHPLAFQLTMAIARTNPESPWIKEQQTRRERLLLLLQASPQGLFETYKDLQSLSRGLVYSGDLLRPKKGKVGLEIEFHGNKKMRESIKRKDYRRLKRLYYSDPSLRRGLDTCWEVANDIAHNQRDRNRVEVVGELKRAIGFIDHDASYDTSLTPMGKWLRDNASELLSLHLHLDRKLHPTKPTLSELYLYDGVVNNSLILCNKRRE